MPVKKGHTNNPNGRPSDPNVKKLREAVRGKLIEDKRIKKLFDCLDDLDGKEYIDFFLRIQREVVPALAAESPEADQGQQKDLAAVMEMVYNKLSGTG